MTAQALQKTVDISLEAPTPQEALKAVILAMSENEALIQHLMASQRRQEMERLLVQATRVYLQKMLRTQASGLTVKTADLDAAIAFYSYGLVGMLLENLGKGKDANVLANQLFRLLTGEILAGPRDRD